MYTEKTEITISVPLYVLDANYDRRGYFTRVSHHAGQLRCSDKEAWEKTEEELQRYGLPTRYNSYRSFITGRCKYMDSLKRRK